MSPPPGNWANPLPHWVLSLQAELRPKDRILPKGVHKQERELGVEISNAFRSSRFLSTYREFQRLSETIEKGGGGRLLFVSLQFPENIKFIKHRFQLLDLLTISTGVRSRIFLLAIYSAAPKLFLSRRDEGNSAVKFLQKESRAYAENGAHLSFWDLVNYFSR